MWSDDRNSYTGSKHNVETSRTVPSCTCPRRRVSHKKNCRACTMCGLHTRRFVVYPFCSYPRRVTFCCVRRTARGVSTVFVYLYERLLFPKPAGSQCVYLTNVLEFFVISPLYTCKYIGFIITFRTKNMYPQTLISFVEKHIFIHRVTRGKIYLIAMFSCHNFNRALNLLITCIFRSYKRNFEIRILDVKIEWRSVLMYYLNADWRTETICS